MDTLSYRTISANAQTVVKDWVIVDAQSAVLGRFASQVAMIIRGKHKASYTPHVDCGDNVIVINADKIRLTGKKMNEKEIISYTGYPGGQRFITPKKMLIKVPTRLVERAIRLMLPKNRLGRKLFTNLYVYAGSEHPHQAQQPKKIELKWK
ncbi:MAG: 50S ribosomal protein L13 [Bacteroidetes bacterium]|nr:MAG: 50S ribosomal protein L13 [Bacteroidota bacterium]